MLRVFEGRSFNVAQVVVALLHLEPDGGVRAPRLLRRRSRGAGSARELAMQADQRLQRVIGERARSAYVGEAQPGIAQSGLRPFEFDLECAAVIRSLALE